jgi:hypothetical protein
MRLRLTQSRQVAKETQSNPNNSLIHLNLIAVCLCWSIFSSAALREIFSLRNKFFRRETVGYAGAARAQNLPDNDRRHVSTATALPARQLSIPNVFGGDWTAIDQREMSRSGNAILSPLLPE